MEKNKMTEPEMPEEIYVMPYSADTIGGHRDGSWSAKREDYLKDQVVTQYIKSDCLTPPVSDEPPEEISLFYYDGWQAGDVSDFPGAIHYIRADKSDEKDREIERLRGALKWAMSTIIMEPFEWSDEDMADAHRDAIECLSGVKGESDV